MSTKNVERKKKIKKTKPIYKQYTKQQIFRSARAKVSELMQQNGQMRYVLSHCSLLSPIKIRTLVRISMSKTIWKNIYTIQYQNIYQYEADYFVSESIRETVSYFYKLINPITGKNR